MRLHDYISNFIINIINFELKYCQHDNRNPTILLYVRYNEILRNEKKLKKNISNYFQIEKNISDYKQIYKNNSKQIYLDLNRFKQKMKQLFIRIL